MIRKRKPTLQAVWVIEVPGTGLEPAQMNPLEPKPSASTNSAIPARAQCDQVFYGWQVANAKKIHIA